MNIRIYDAYRLGLITNEEYSELLASGRSPNSFYDPSEGVSIIPDFLNYVSGTTTSSVKTALDCYVVGSTKQSVSVKNTSPSNNMNLSIEYYIASILSNTIEQVLIPGQVYFLETESAFQKIIVKVQDVIPGMHCTYEVGVDVS